SVLARPGRAVPPSPSGKLSVETSMSTPGLNRRDALRKMVVGGLGAAAAPAWVESLSAAAQASSVHAAHAAAAAEPAWTPKVLDRHQREAVCTTREQSSPPAA